MKITQLALNLYNSLLCEAKSHQGYDGGYLTLLAVDREDNYPYITEHIDNAHYAVFNAYGTPQVFEVHDSQLNTEVHPARGKSSGFPLEVVVPVETTTPDDDAVRYSMLCDDAQHRLYDIRLPMLNVLRERTSSPNATILVNWLNEHDINWSNDIRRAVLDIHNGKPRMALNPDWVDNIKPTSTLIYALASVLSSHRNYILTNIDIDMYS